MNEPFGLSAPPTRLDSGGFGWRVGGALIQIREIGAESAYALPDQPFAELIIGSADDCAIQLQGLRGWISRRHARLVREGALWSIHDLGSTNGTWVDGARRSTFSLTPGTEIQIGDISLVSESRSFVALRGLVSRLLGWAAAQRVVVDRALRDLRETASMQTSLVIDGEGDLVPVARRLHDEMLGIDSPFVSLDDETDARRAVACAADGTLCVTRRLTPDLATIIVNARSANRARIIVCAPGDDRASCALLGHAARLEISPLAKRLRELTRIVEECASEAATHFEQPITGLRTSDLRLLRSLPFAGISDLESTAWRLVAIRTLGITEGAARLGVTHGALSRWATRRSIVP
ncbi:MAG: FHA domain-containing protein [Kofleriaceae bacterium]